MSLKYRKVQRQVLAGEEKGTFKTYAVAKSGTCKIEKLCKLVAAHSKMSSADVKSMLDSLNWAMDLELLAGNIVQLGEFGNFRLTISSEGAANEDSFKAQMIRKARVVFHPGVTLKKAVANIQFEYDEPQKVTVVEDCEKPHAI